MKKLDHPIVRTSSHAGKDYPVAILTQASEGRVSVLDVEKGEPFDAPLDWVRIHSRPAYRGAGSAAREDEITQMITDLGFGTPVFDHGATEPMKSWAEANAG